MVKKETAVAGKIKKRKGRFSSFMSLSLSFMVLFPMLLLMLPTVVFMFLSMLPTLIALVVDAGSRAKAKYKWLCIGGVNFAGALPFLFKLWFGSNTLDGAIDLFINGVAFIIIYLAAAVGWVFYRCIPPVVLNCVEMSDQRRVVYLRELQAKLIAKWGEEVAEGAEIKMPQFSAAIARKSTAPDAVKTSAD